MAQAQREERQVSSKATPAVRRVTRRRFLVDSFAVAAWTAFWAGFLTILLWPLRILFPNVIYEPPTKFKAGRPEEYPPGSVDERWKPSYRVWVVREEKGFYVLYAQCTHLGCTPNWLPGENKFKCPCHGSGFRRDGTNFEGPAPRALERCWIGLAEDGQLLIDTSVRFVKEKGEWEKPNAFLKV